jgi:LuxR family maltose regulon positive regulatory protein
MVHLQTTPLPTMRRNGHHDSLIMTKLRIPPFRSGLISRPELTQLLEANVHRKLTLLSTPAGYGKTTLLSEWAAQTQYPTVWITLDDQDNLTERFWTYFVIALQTIHPDIGETALNSLRSPNFSAIESMLTSLINELALTHETIVLVLDNYHLIHTPAIHTGITFLLEHLPAQLHPVIASRTTPPLPLARLRALGQLNGLYLNDLRFSLQEIKTLMNHVHDWDCTEADLQTLERRTEGWITGLTLALLHEFQDDHQLFISGNHRHLADYFAEEVFDKQPRWIQEFLLATAILDSFNAELCDAVTERNDSRNLLETLERENLFILPLDKARQQYRYHTLFGEFLRSRLTFYKPEDIQALHRRATNWYALHHQAAEAIQHSLAARDFERAAELAEASAENLWVNGQIITLRQWLEALPSDLLRSRARLCLFHAWSLFFSEHQLYAAETRIADVERLLPDLDTPAEVQGMLETIRAAFAVRREEAREAIILSQNALKQLPPDNLKWRSAATLSLGIGSLTMGDTETAHRTLSEATILSQMAEHPLNDVIATYNQGRVQLLQGHLSQAAIFFRRAIELAEKYDLQLPIGGTARIGMGYLLYEWNNLDLAVESLQDGIQLSRQIGNVEAPLRGYIYLAQISSARQKPDEALDFLQLAEHLARRANQPTFIEQVEAYEARFWLAQGNLDAAGRWARRAQPMCETDPAFMREIKCLTLARIWIAQGDIDQSLQLLHSLIADAEGMGRTRSMIEILTLQSLAYEQQGNTEEALTNIRHVLSLAEPGGFIRIFVDEGKPMSTLLRHAASRGIFTHYVSRLLSAFSDSGHFSLATSQPLIDPLSERELEVLRLIAQGLSNHEIATELFVAVSTVKTHVKSIYRKLNVGNRFEAIERVRDLSLFNGDNRTTWKD